jgi:hypothetical protein
MSDAGEREKTVEIMISDVGEMHIVLRPRLPFLVEGYRILEKQIELFGEGERLGLEIPEELVTEALEADQALVTEFPRTGAMPVRETDILKQ